MLSAFEASRQRILSLERENSEALAQSPAQSQVPQPASTFPKVEFVINTQENGVNGDGNSLAPLAVDQEKKISPVRSIRELGVSTVEVDLSEGQTFVVLGLCSFWVKDGTVSILGALLPASSTVHRLYSPRTHALLGVEGVDASSTVVLQSADDAIRHLPGFQRRNVWDAYASGARSFHVLGHSPRYGPVSPAIRGLKIINMSQWKSAIASASSPGRTMLNLHIGADLPSGTADGSARRIFVAGSRCAGKSTFTKCVINRMLTNRDPFTKRLYHPNGVYLIDMDSTQPECSAPEIVYLAHIRVPMLGPSYTHPLFPDSYPGHILRMHHQFASNQQTRWHHAALEDLLTHHAALTTNRHCPLVIDTSKWLGGFSFQQGLLPWAAIAPTDVVCLDSPVDARFRGVLSEYAQSSNSRFYPLRAMPLKRSMTSDDSRSLQLEAYFHISKTDSNMPCWNVVSPLVSGVGLTLEYKSQDSLLWAILQYQVAPETKLRRKKLEHSIVAVIAVKEDLATDLITKGHERGAQIVNLEPGGPPYLLLPDERSRISIDPTRSECLGTGFVPSDYLDKEAGKLTINTMVKMEAVKAKAAEGKKIVLMIGDYI